jgi:hypothetical protein
LAACYGHDGAMKLLVSWRVDATIKDKVGFEMQQIMTCELFIISQLSTNPLLSCSMGRQPEI